MKRRTLLCSTLVCFFALATGGSPVSAASEDDIPHLHKQGTVTQLIVDGKPLVLVTGELEDSTSTSLDNLRRIWPSLVEMNLNTVFPVVYWGLFEPEEGKFDFTPRRRHDRFGPAQPSASRAWCGSEAGRTACRSTPRSG